MSIKYDIWYIFCYSEDNFGKALERLKLSISSIPKKYRINILTWHNNLEQNLNLKDKNIKIFLVEKKEFSKSFYLNKIAFIYDYNNYFYLADNDLYFHNEYFNWLEYISDELDYNKNDLRIITLNYNLRAKKKLYFLPDKLYPILSEKFPFLYDWDLPKDLEDILRSFDMKSGFAHGCGLIPIKPLKEIGGYNEEMIGYGPEDDLFNRRLALNARTYYHRGTFRSSTFHICHRNLNHQNKLSNWLYWKKIIYDLNRNGVHSDGRIINR